MKISFEDINDDVICRISDFDSKYLPILQTHNYLEDNNTFIKIYRNKRMYPDKIKKRFSQYAQTMFDQFGDFTDVPWEESLKKFCSMVDGKNIDWWLIGSCSACIRGVCLNPHDIDIMIDSKHTDELSELFQDYLIEPIADTDGWVVKEYGAMFIGVRIDVFSDPLGILDYNEPLDCGPFARNNLEIINWAGFDIKVPLLSLQLNVNRRRGRIDRINKIEEYLGNDK